MLRGSPRWNFCHILHHRGGARHVVNGTITRKLMQKLPIIKEKYYSLLSVNQEHATAY